MANQWFKFYGGEYLSDPKIGRLSPAERSCWITLLSMASMSDDGIIKYLDIDDLLEKSGIHHNPYNEGDWEKCQNVLVKLSQMKMLSVDDKESIIQIINWSKRQEYNMTIAERVAKHRQNKKCNKNVTIDVTNVTTEESRIEENRIENNIYKQISYLQKLPDNDIEEFNKRFDCSKKAIQSKAEDLVNYCKSKGKVYKDYRAFLLNALKKDFPERNKQIPQVYIQQPKIEVPKGTLEKYKPNFLK